MPIVKKYRFEKLTNGNVLLYNIQTNSLVVVFSGPQMLVKNIFNTNAFFITNTSFKNKDTMLDWREIDCTTCIPVISFNNSFDNVLLELANTFFFISKTNTPAIIISQKVNYYTDLISGSEVSQIAYVNNNQGNSILPWGGTFYPAGWYQWNGTTWQSDNNAIANAINQIFLKDDLSEFTNNSINPFTRKDDDFNNDLVAKYLTSKL